LQLDEALQDAFGVEADDHHTSFFHGFRAFVGLTDVEGTEVHDGGFITVVINNVKNMK
jgi:hypothetical protein